jgi:hypothetical protein
MAGKKSSTRGRGFATNTNTNNQHFHCTISTTINFIE